MSVASAYASAALDRECAEVAGTVAGRNSRLNAAAFAIGRLVGAGEIDRRIAELHLFDAAQACGYAQKDGPAAARATIKSGLDQGERLPRDIPRNAERPRIEIPRRRDIVSPANPKRRDLARHLWGIRQSIAGSPAEVYLRQARGLSGPFPPTLGYLPPRNDHPAAMIAAFGFATESEPGTLAIDPRAVAAVHLTKLRSDGSGKADVDPATVKIMIASPRGFPIVLAPPNDALGLAITEGIEDAASAHEATGLGAWAAGSATFMPALADAVPSYIERVTILAHDDPGGIRHSHELHARLAARGIPGAVTFLRSAPHEA
jgi:hypothetical protein